MDPPRNLAMQKPNNGQNVPDDGKRHSDEVAPDSLSQLPTFLNSRQRSRSLLLSLTSSCNTSRKSLSELGTESSPVRGSMSMPLRVSSGSKALAGSSSRPLSTTSLEGINVDQLPQDEREGENVSKRESMSESLDVRSGQNSVSQPSKVARTGQPESEGNRLSFSSQPSISSVHGSFPPPKSTGSSLAGSIKSNSTEQSNATNGMAFPSTATVRGEAHLAPTTATDNISVTASLTSTQAVEPLKQAGRSNRNSAAVYLESSESSSLPRLQNTAPDTRRSRSRTQRRPSVSTGASSASPNNSERTNKMKAPLGKIGVCALDGKARSKPSRNILTRLQSNGDFEVIVFGDKVILDEAVENWPLCDYLISFFSDGFPLEKAIAYAHLRKPFCVNDLPMQQILWDRRLCLRILDHLNIPTPKRIEVNRDGGPKLLSHALVDHVYKMSGVKLNGPGITVDENSFTKSVDLVDDGDTLTVDGISLKKPFVEKPVNGEDHNVRIYFPKSMDGGGGRKLFRKIGNKSSEWDSNLTIPRAITEKSSSYLYEQFLDVDNAEDVKAYTVGADFCHAETRKSPVVDGLVRRNTHGKEIRYITSLSKEEASIASRISYGFGQRICGFDLLRAKNKSFVIDVNGWSFVKDNNEYYDKCSGILKQMFIQEKEKRDTMKATSMEQNNDNTIDIPAKPKPVSHRTGIKGLLDSPSLSKLRGHQHGHKSQASSPDPSGTTTPISSPPTIDRPGLGISLPTVPSTSDSLLPAPLTDHGQNSSLPASLSADQLAPKTAPPPASKHSWKLKGMVAVIRHADRTPKQKFKFTFHTQPFIDLLKGHQEEVLLKGEHALGSVLAAVKQAMEEGIEDREKLNLLRTSLARKGAWTGTKVQIKPMFRKRDPGEYAASAGTSNTADIKMGGKKTGDSGLDDEALDLTKTRRSDSLTGVTLSRFSAVENDLVLDKLQLIIKWGGEPTHSARYQAQDLGESMRNDLLLMNREALGDVRVFTSSEPRVSTSAQIWAASFLDQKDVPDSFISVRKDLLDDSNAAKDVMDIVKKKLKLLLRAGHEAPSQFAWPVNTPEPAAVVRRVTELMTFHRKVMRHNFKKINSASSSLSTLNTSSDSSAASSTGRGSSLALAQAVANIQSRWCTGEDAELFRERWEKLFSEFSDSDKVDPSKISELYDTMKYDALHNRQFLEWAFTPSQNLWDEIAAADGKYFVDKQTMETSVPEKQPADRTSEDRRASSEKLERRGSNLGLSGEKQLPSNTIAQRMGFRRKSVLPGAESPIAPQQYEDSESYFKLFNGNGQTRAKQDQRLEKLRELYRYAKILFDFICPQEYGISDSEKLEIGLLTSLPLLKEIVSDLEEVQASEDAKSFIYFTKESHVYTLLNAILEGGIKTKIARNTIPELDYLSQIVFELYEAEDKEADSFAYSIRITLTPGCHTADPLDVQLDSKHSIGCAPRRSLTAHADWKEVIETLRAKFHTVKLPKSFLAVNLSEWHAKEARGKLGASNGEDEMGGEEKKVGETHSVTAGKLYGDQSETEKGEK